MIIFSILSIAFGFVFKYARRRFLCPDQFFSFSKREPRGRFSGNDVIFYAELDEIRCTRNPSEKYISKIASLNGAATLSWRSSL